MDRLQLYVDDTYTLRANVYETIAGVKGVYQYQDG